MAAASASRVVTEAAAAAWRTRFAAAQEAAVATYVPGVAHIVDTWRESGRLAVALTQDECRVAADIGRARNARNRESGVRDGKRSKTMSSEDIDVQGAIAEYGALRALGLDVAPLLNTDPRCVATDDGADMVLDDGRSIDVKSSYCKFDNIHGNRFDLEVHPNKQRSSTDIFMKVLLHTPAILTAGTPGTHATIAARVADETLRGDHTCCVAILAGYATADEVFCARTPMGGINNQYRLVQAFRTRRTTELVAR